MLSQLYSSSLVLLHPLTSYHISKKFMVSRKGPQKSGHFDTARNVCKFSNIMEIVSTLSKSVKNIYFQKTNAFVGLTSHITQVLWRMLFPTSVS